MKENQTQFQVAQTNSQTQFLFCFTKNPTKLIGLISFQNPGLIILEAYLKQQKNNNNN